MFTYSNSSIQIQIAIHGRLIKTVTYFTWVTLMVARQVFALLPLTFSATSHPMQFASVFCIKMLIAPAWRWFIYSKINENSD